MTHHTILITGANRGIGLALVKQYAQHNYHVLACCRAPSDAISLEALAATYPHIDIYPLDVQDEASIARLASCLQDTPIDILFNNAGVAGIDKPWGEYTQADLLSLFLTNAAGPTLVSQACYSNLLKGRTKLIVNMSSFLSSIALNQRHDWFWLAYRMSKAALNAATRSLAHTLAKEGITVIALDPGWVQTDMGGKDAPLTVTESVSSIRATLDACSMKDSGNLIRYDGSSLPW